jgi:outer membrane protein
MRFMIRATSVALIALASATGSAGAQTIPKFAYLNSQQILVEAPGRAEAQAQFEREMNTFRTKVQLMGDSLNALMADYNKQEVVLSPAAREAKQKSIRAKEEDYQKRTQAMQAQAEQRNVELMQPIMEQIQKIIDDVRAEEGYTMIFDVGASGGSVVSADRNLDITPRIIARLKAAGVPKRDTTAKATKGAPMSAPAGVQPKKPPR